MMDIEMMKTLREALSQKSNPNRAEPVEKPGLDLLEKDEVKEKKAHPAVPGRSIYSMRVPCAGDQRRAGGDIGWLGRDR